MRDLTDLENNAVKFFPTALTEQERNISIIPKLIETQDKFISLLNISDASPTAWKDTLYATSSLPANLFLKHLAVLSDIGGEKLMRFKGELPNVFTDGIMNFSWNGNQYSYTFRTLNQRRKWNNPSLFIDGDGLSEVVELTPMIEDVCMLLLFGGASTPENLPEIIAENCVIGTMLGKSEELDTFVKQRYIWVSRIIRGATSNTLGQLSQDYVKEFIQRELPTWRINQDQLTGISHNERTSLSVDIVAKAPNGVICAIEVSFQVTTNSVIERKAGQAQARQELLHSHGYKIAYVIDGAGNFERRSALTGICQYSDCTVTFKDEELGKLVEFLKGLE
jgi:hypothetical protein